MGRKQQDNAPALAAQAGYTVVIGSVPERSSNAAAVAKSTVAGGPADANSSAVRLCAG